MGIDELRAEHAELKAENAELRAAIAERDARLAAMDKRLEELERKARKNSTNSSAPPSSDGPNVQRPKKPPTGKRRGGQRGHKGTTRVLVPESRVNAIVEHPIEGTCQCGCSDVDLRAPRRHQVWELPNIAPHVTEHRLQRGRCRGCRRRRRAAWPPGVAQGCLGPLMQAMVASLTGTYQLSRRDAERFLDENFGMKVSLGTVSNTEAVVSEALKPAWEEARDHVREAPVKNVDETGHASPEGKTAWAASTKEAVCVQLGLDRSRKSLHALLGDDVKGIVGSDRYVVYDELDPTRRQLCWSHILRAFQALVDEGGDAARVGGMLLDLGRQVLHAWNEWKRHRKRRDEIEPILRRSRADFERVLPKYADLLGLRTLAHAFVLTPPSVWLFTTRDDVEPTNNRVERDLRPLVIWGKTSFFTQSARGDRFKERMLTVTQTLRRRGSRLFGFLVDSVQAPLIGSATPRLLPSR